MQGAQDGYQPSFWQGFASRVQQFFDNAKFQVGEFFNGLLAQIKGLFADKGPQVHQETAKGLSQGDFSGVGDQAKGTPVFLQEKGGSGGELKDEMQEQSSDHFLDSLESGQSIFDPMVIEQMTGSKEEILGPARTTSVEIEQEEQVMMPEFLEPQQIDVEAGIREVDQVPIVEGKMIDTVARSEYEMSSRSISDEELKLVQAEQTLVLSPQQSSAAVMPAERWETVKPEIKTPSDVKQPTLME